MGVMRRKLFKPQQAPYSSPPPISPEDMTLAKDIPVTLAVIGCGQRGNVSGLHVLLAVAHIQHQYRSIVLTLSARTGYESERESAMNAC